MSAETIEWLNSNVMLGFTAHREKYHGKGWTFLDPDSGEVRAWWHQPGYKLGYSEAIPPEEVVKHLFNWTPVETEIMHKVRVQTAEEGDAQDGNGWFKWVPDTRFKGIIHPDTEYVFGTFGIESYRIHGYEQWLMKNVNQLLDGEAGIATAGLLRQGGVAWVQVELPDEIETNSGMGIRPSLLAATSVDGTKATTYKMTTGVSVCDNSMELNLTGAGDAFKVKHSSRSLGKLNDARQALGIIYKQAEEMAAFLDSLAAVDVTDAQFKQIINQIKPIPEPEAGTNKKGESAIVNQRAITIAENTQGELWNLWHRDQRAAQWNGTLLGAFQSVNTWHNHMRSNSDNGVERVMTATLSGDVAKFDAAFFDIVKSLEIPGAVNLVGVK